MNNITVQSIKAIILETLLEFKLIKEFDVTNEMRKYDKFLTEKINESIGIEEVIPQL